MIGHYTATLFSIAGLLAMLPVLSTAVSPVASAVVIKESRQLVDAGKWDEAGKLLEEHLKKVKDAVEVARLRAELAHYAADRNIYFQRTKTLSGKR